MDRKMWSYWMSRGLNVFGGREHSTHRYWTHAHPSRRARRARRKAERRAR